MTEAISDEDREIFDGFVSEASESLESIEADVLSLDATTEDPEIINRIFRCMHSIKGASGYLNLGTIQRVSHCAETVLNALRDRNIVAEAAVVELLLRVVDVLKDCLLREDSGEGLDIQQLTVALDQAAVGELPGGPAPSAEAVPEPSPADAPASETPSPPAPSAPEAGPPQADKPEPSPQAAKARAPAPKKKPSAAANDGGPAKARPQNDTIRVNLGVLDEIMNLCGEVVLGRNQVLDHLDDDPAFAVLSKRITELHKHVLKIRMQPIGTIFSRFNRVIRDLSRSLGKSMKLDVSGHEVELDRTIVEALAEPLMHLIRNAADHAIETPDERALTGKSQQGRIDLRAYQESGQVVIEVADDGRGIDGDRVRAKAISKGLTSQDAAARLSYQESIQFIFQPGFSTRDEATEVSGRGVGMDVVKTAFERVGGTIHIHSVPGEGTTFTARLPLTLAIASAIVVRCGGVRYAVPQASVNEIIRLTPGAEGSVFRRLGGQRVYQFRDQVIPVMRISEVLRGSPDAAGEAESNDPILLILDQGKFFFGLSIDAIDGAREIVVKRLPHFMRACDLYSGETIMGDGRVAMIFDVSGVADLLGTFSAGDRTAEDRRGAAMAAGSAAERQRMVVFTGHADERFAIPLDLVGQVEKIQAGDIQRIGKREVVELGGVPTPLIRLDKFIDARPISPDATDLFVILPARVRCRVGVLASEILRTLLFEQEVDTSYGDQMGMLGSSIVDGNVLSILDVHSLVLAEMGKPRTEENLVTGDILLAEDTSFFRQLVVEYLQSVGHRVTTAKDGSEALRVLQEKPTAFQLVVSDIEMPEMNGWELVKAVKSDPRLRHIPVVALTTITPTGTEQSHDARLFDAYRNKIDRADLIETVASLLPAANANSGVAGTGTRTG